MNRSGLLTLLALLCGCRWGSTECFKVWSSEGPATSSAGEEVFYSSEVFVMTNPPAEARELRQAMYSACGPLPIPAAGAYRVDRYLLQESRNTPRTVVIREGTHQSLDAHQDDIILHVMANHELCWCDEFRVRFYRDGDLVSTERWPPEFHPITPPEWCGKSKLPKPQPTH